MMTEQDLDLIREALALAAEDIPVPDGVLDPPRRADVILFAIGQAASTLKRLPDREMRFLSGLRSSSPEPSIDPEDLKDMRELWVTMLERIQAGEEAVDPIPIREPLPTPREISRMWAVLSHLGALVRPMTRSVKRTVRLGNTIYRSKVPVDVKARDWKIIVLFAMGVPAARIAKLVSVSTKSVYERRELQACLIADGLSFAHPGLWQGISVCDPFKSHSLTFRRKKSVQFSPQDKANQA